MTISVDPGADIVRIRGRGQYSEYVLRRHFVELERAMTEMRRNSGSAPVLVELGDGAVQTAEVAVIVQEVSERLFGEADFLAILCQSMLQTFQLRRNGPAGRMRQCPADGEADAIQ